MLDNRDTITLLENRFSRIKAITSLLSAATIENLENETIGWTCEILDSYIEEIEKHIGIR